ncbi:DNA-3-methyladenine glycosylase [Ilumatobacter coccineus]|uniref:Putative 3-methyladenine DNA glycosylase n=1 Tax=Ilumatobacter coccineus (strain NBRC 103263 / KCTC 29153 / YM16-304) TaxID=1313172 RepID=A0A6C7EB19_ILUCY|nr:DNA-3-methyladenine glycosylase [Ilumatobacter coccineus]BAN02399.1 putative 3-methyladenine DNA glycosylase [Ilumatobacter coccineus YM16-304]
MAAIRRTDLARSASVVAPWLLNKLLVSTVDGRTVAGRIAEVEAYEQDDPASHTFGGRTARNEVMFGRAGHLYVYLSYGIHFCANVVTGPEGSGEAVLIRSVAIESGLDDAAARRGDRPRRELSNGPGKLCQAFGVGLPHDGADLLAGGPVRLLDDGVAPPPHPLVGPRIGISKGVDTPWRFRVPAEGPTT